MQKNAFTMQKIIQKTSCKMHLDADNRNQFAEKCF